MPRAGLTREKVLEAALRLLDAHGSDAVSMRRIGEDLGVEAMSLYRYVESKDDLLDGVYEALLLAVPLPARRGPWARDLVDLARAYRHVLTAHPNAIVLLATRPAVTPASIAYLEAGLAILLDAGLRPRAALGAFQSLRAFVVGSVLAELGATPSGGRPRVDYASLRADRFPRLASMHATLRKYDGAGDFEAGLATWIRGLERTLAEPTRRR